MFGNAPAARATGSHGNETSSKHSKNLNKYKDFHSSRCYFGLLLMVFLLFTDEILYDKFFLKAFLKAINLFVNLKMDEMTLEKFRLWNTAALKVYLSVREKSIEGSFDELASR